MDERWQVSAACVARLGAVADWWRSWLMANKLACCVHAPGGHFKHTWWLSTCLARSANLPEELYILLALISFFLMIVLRTIISGSTGRFSRFFSEWQAFVDNLSETLFPYPQRTLLWQTILGEISRIIFIRQAGVPTRMIRNMAVPIQKYFRAIMYPMQIFIKIGPVTTEITWLTTALVWTRRQKCTYPTKYLGKYWTELYQIFSIGRHMYGDC